MNPVLYQSYRFFKQHAGYVVGRRAECALSLARAELRAERAELFVRWEPDCYTKPSDWMEQGAELRELMGKLTRAVWGIYTATVVSPCEACGGHTSTLMGVFLDHTIPGDGDPYKRVVEAELYLEHYVSTEPLSITDR